jgi:hypothetical protein
MRALKSTVCAALLLIVLFPRLCAQNSQDSGAITVIGTLVQVAGIGAETTGWAIKLDSAKEFEGKRLKSLEVSGELRELTRLENKRVKASGKIVIRHRTERGEWLVLVVGTMQQEKSN